jgi:hypothetical protein
MPKYLVTADLRYKAQMFVNALTPTEAEGIAYDSDASDWEEVTACMAEGIKVTCVGSTTRNAVEEKCLDCDEPYSKHHLCPDEKAQDELQRSKDGEK